MIHSLAIAGLAIVSLLGLAPRVAAAPSSVASQEVLNPVQQAPPSFEEGPLEVMLSLMVIDVYSIHEASEMFEGDFVYSLKWRDPRLVTELGLGDSQVALSDVWSPVVAIMNQKAVREYLPRVIYISDDGTAIYRQRIQGQFSCKLDLRRFPFDIQTLPLSMVVVGHGDKEIVLVPETVMAQSLPEISPAGWELETARTEVTSEPIPSRGHSLSRVNHRLMAQRLPGYYWMKIFLPLTLIIFMAWAVFWINPVDSGPQIGVATSSVFTLIAFSLMINRTLPRIAYSTLADEFVLGATLLVFLALAEAIVTGHMAKAGRLEQAQKVDRAARFVYPLLYILLGSFTIFDLL